MNWTPEIDQYIRDNYQSMTKKQMAETLKTTHGAIIARVVKLDLRKRQHKKKLKPHKRFPDSVRANLGMN
jgi:hypothetical protein